MPRPNLITQYMNSPLPGRSEQRRMSFRPEKDEVVKIYRAINRCVFNNRLTRPEIILGVIPDCWGMCIWEDEKQKHSSWGREGTWCRIHLSDKWYSPQWMVTTLAHEMVHQWQWDVYRWKHLKKNKREMPIESGAHGPSFHYWKPKLASWGIHLKIRYLSDNWWRHQDLFKC